MCCDFDYLPKDVWKTVSKEAKSMISGLLELEIDKRLTPSECLEHSWLARTHTDFLSYEIDKNLLKRMMFYKRTNNLMFICQRIITSCFLDEETDSLIA